MQCIVHGIAPSYFCDHSSVVQTELFGQRCPKDVGQQTKKLLSGRQTKSKQSPNSEATVHLM